MHSVQIRGAEDYGKWCCFIDDSGEEVCGRLSLFMEAISKNPNEGNIYFRREDDKPYRLAWKLTKEEIKGLKINDRYK